jgi:S-adenosylmethionine/arginine decarboxylase-like enzyme
MHDDDDDEEEKRERLHKLNWMSAGVSVVVVVVAHIAIHKRSAKLSST